MFDAVVIMLERITPRIEWGGTWTNAIDRPHFEVKLIG